MNYTTNTRFERKQQYYTALDDTFSHIVSVFGEPMGKDDEEYSEFLFDAEILCEWYITFEDGGRVLIWGHADDLTILCDDTHSDPRYHKKKDLRENMHPWKIWGSTPEALSRVCSLLDS